VITAESADRRFSIEMPTEKEVGVLMLIHRKDDLPAVRIDGEVAARIFEGAQHGGLGSSAFIVDAAPGQRPRRHLHPYDEIFVLVHGSVLLEADGELHELSPDELCVVPSGVAHTFTVTGADRAQLVNIHTSGRVVTEWAEEHSASSSYAYGLPHAPGKE
jgi:quercetin dioxygenase-like cupin family protein